MKRWIKDFYIKCLKFNTPVNHIQIFEIAAKDESEDDNQIYVHDNPGPVNHFTAQQFIDKINAKVD